MKSHFINKRGMPSWFVLVFVPLLAILVVLILIPITQRSVVGDIVKTGTPPQSIYNVTTSSMVITENELTTFDEYFNSFKKDNSNQDVLDSDYELNSPRLEYNYSFYDRREYYDRCRTKKPEINFTTPRTSSFNFNYLNKTFNYNIDVYTSLYFFTDKLKEQDCYFKEDQYSQGYLLNPYNNNFVDIIANDFLNLKNEGYSDDEIVEIATLFVQSIPYGTDQSQLNRFPYETIYEMEGNCLDKSVILVKILEKLNYTTYFILGQAKQYHALVGIECERGNVIYNGKTLCFAETTVFTPIGSNVTIDIEKLILTSTGNKIYKGKNYGPQLVSKFKSEHEKRKKIEKDIDEINIQLENIQELMCQTDCVVCKGNNVDFELSKQEIGTTCSDATQYNGLVQEYNGYVNNYNQKISDWYKIYYELENSMFNNIKLLEKN